MSRQRLAIVGPTDSVNLIYAAAEKRTSSLAPLPVIYRDASEVPAILRSMQSEADIWLFSGVVPYRHALTVPRWNKPLLYIPHAGSSLYRAFLQITQTAGMTLQHISFDTYHRDEIEEVYRDLDFPLPPIHLRYYEGTICAEELTEFHHQLWRQNKTQVAVTCFLKTAVQLKALGVPTFRIWPTPNNIRTALDTASRLAEAMCYSESQIAVSHIEIDNYALLVRNANSSYDVSRLEIGLHELLIDFAQQVGGSLIPQGKGSYIIFTTRGRIAAITGDFTILPLLNAIRDDLHIHVSGGIGFGTTAYQAEENAHIAHGLAKRLGPGQWLIVTDDQRTLGPLSADEGGRRFNGEQQRLLAKRLQISLLTLNQLAELVAESKDVAISINDLAARLALTPRSARRIMSALREAGFACVSGEDAAGKGRPRKLYRFTGDNLLDKQ
ncbi:MAG: GTP cyclohydrolase [Sporomusaceae bacterium]|nr:GTP cyclohydrolase [Sporomusaceae bacterium]